MTNEEQKLKETLSALLDGEAGKIDQLELRRLARALEDRPELLEIYRRYTVTQAVMKNDVVEAIAGSTLLANIHAAIAGTTMDEVASAQASGERAADNRLRWLPSAGRVAIAASVAVIAVYLVQVRPVTDIQSPVVANAPVVAASSGKLPVLQSGQLVMPDRMTVSAGDNHNFNEQARNGQPVVGSAACVISTPRVDNANQVWEKTLPAGYVLCKQNEQTKQCETFSSTISCYQE